MDSYLIIRAVLALLLVSGLIVLLAIVAKKFGLNRNLIRTGEARLSVAETLVIDQKRRLLLVRRDNTEHLLLLGGTSDLLIESFPRKEAEGA